RPLESVAARCSQQLSPAHVAPSARSGPERITVTLYRGVTFPRRNGAAEPTRPTPEDPGGFSGASTCPAWSSTKPRRPAGRAWPPPARAGSRRAGRSWRATTSRRARRDAGRRRPLPTEGTRKEVPPHPRNGAKKAADPHPPGGGPQLVLDRPQPT